MMKITLDHGMFRGGKDNDYAYITTPYGHGYYANKMKVKKTRTVHKKGVELVNLDFDKDGKLLGVEIIT